MPSNLLIFCHPLLLLPSIFLSIRVFSSESALRIRWPKFCSFTFSISPSNEYSGLICFTDWLVWSPCCPRDSQESSPTPQLKSINSSALSFLYSPTLTSIQDYWKNHTPSPPALSLSQHQGLFKWVSSSHQVAKVLEFQLQHQSSEYSGLISFRMDWLDLLAVQGTLSRVFSNTLVQKHQFFSAQLSLQSNFNIHRWLLEKP